jgi:hypothetical protein
VGLDGRSRRNKSERGIMETKQVEPLCDRGKTSRFRLWILNTLGNESTEYIALHKPLTRNEEPVNSLCQPNISIGYGSGSFNSHIM